MSAYITAIKTHTTNIHSVLVENTVSPQSTLQTAITQWYESLSPTVRQQRFYMTDLCAIFNAQPEEIGQVLRKLGWSRKREWTTASNRRYWVGPG